MAHDIYGPHPAASLHLWRPGDPDIDPARRRSGSAITACVIHTTGFGEGVARLWAKHKPDLEAFDRAYLERLANVLIYKATFGIGYSGLVSQNAPLGYVTHHSTSSHAQAYQRADWTRRNANGGRADFAWWTQRFAPRSNPTDLPAWGELPSRSINLHTWSIDVVEPPPGMPYPEAQIEAAARVIAQVHTDLRLPITAAYVTTHSEVNPYDRSSPKGVPWDLSSRWPQDRVIERADEIRATLPR